MTITSTEGIAPPSKRGGRPPKFPEPRRPVTVTLPERTLEQLEGIDPDRALAIVKTVSQYGGWSSNEEAVRFVPVSPEGGLLLVRSCHALRRVPGLLLAEVAPGRNLLMVSAGVTAESLELSLVDVLEGQEPVSGADREVFEELVRSFRRSRRQRSVETRQVLLVGAPASD